MKTAGVVFQQLNLWRNLRIVDQKDHLCDNWVRVAGNG